MQIFFLRPNQPNSTVVVCTLILMNLMSSFVRLTQCRLKKQHPESVSTNAHQVTKQSLKKKTKKKKQHLDRWMKKFIPFLLDERGCGFPILCSSLLLCFVFVLVSHTCLCPLYWFETGCSFWSFTFWFMAFWLKLVFDSASNFTSFFCGFLFHFAFYLFLFLFLSFSSKGCKCFQSVE